MTRLLAFCSSLVLVCPVGLACIHGPDDFEGKLSQSRQQALIAWHGGKQELILRPTVQVEGGLPTELAWVVPVPSEPTAYAEAPSATIDKLAEAFAERARRAKKKQPEPQGFSFGDEEEGATALEHLAAVEVGGYSIQPLKAHGAAGAVELNAWLTSHGFGEVPPENLRYYVERDWVWLCVKVTPQSSQVALKPLQVSFPTPQVVYPLKFSTHQGTFELELFVLTRQELPQLKSEAARFGLSAETFTVRLPGATRDAIRSTRLSGKVSVTRLVHAGLSGKAISDWKDDLSFSVE